MILTVDIETKSIGTKILFCDVHFVIQPGEKVALIGRNGVGKTSLFSMLSGDDEDFEGIIQTRRGAALVATAQEHHDLSEESVVEYILAHLTEYSELKHIIDTYPDLMGKNMKKIEVYTTALTRFSDLGFYEIEDKIVNSLHGYGITEKMARSPMKLLSGGQKRFAELVRIEHSHADIILIDEPTNHMDSNAKEVFVSWLKSTKQTVVVITHDRDVLSHVQRIIEIKNLQSYSYPGNYDAYLRQNTSSTSSSIHDYEVNLKTLDNLQRKISWARSRAPSWHGTADQRNPFVVMERRLQKQYDEIQRQNEKPSFWIDRESITTLDKKTADNYHKFKTKNIRIEKAKADDHSSELLRVEMLKLGYSEPLFNPVTFQLSHGDRLRICGRNGVGKTTLVKAISSAANNQQADTFISGEIICSKKLRLSVYEQELSSGLLDMPLNEAVEAIYRAYDIAVSQERIKQILSDYLFDPHRDERLLVRNLSGGQKARLQIIRMLANNPNLLILDEPTNHLDLPSIEELENALKHYHGALLYITHDSYFARQMGGKELTLVKKKLSGSAV